MIIIWKSPKSIVGCTKCPHGPHGACAPRVWDPFCAL